MAIWNLGSINLDIVYSMSRLPLAGETLAADRVEQFLGGKGANMSVAAARAGATVHHIGAIGPDGENARTKLDSFGVGIDHVVTLDRPSGHAIIAVAAEDGENQIILFAGANRAITKDQVRMAFANARETDLFITQNETNMQLEAAKVAKEKGLRVCYAAAPFDVEAVRQILPYLDFLILNEVEAEQLEASIGKAPQQLGIRDVIITLGADGARHFAGDTGEMRTVAAHKVEAVDTTGAGDTFTGYVLAGLDQGLSMADAMEQASRAGALMVMRHGTADVIPTLAEVKAASFD
ncbi:ribokinase [Epibacterium sp. SM1969]|uniref:Ribokinase n=1 Tax=Tritonibacter aquimaris TaxID=2663379 RepID=A0A844AVC5_9RHOB|nr:ribokinase [Tritonibacter aquimaris]MQY41872.1 ribokinase [Tritonibacter aquimaris]